MCGSLPPALAARGHRVMVVAPRYANYDVANDSQAINCPSSCFHHVWHPPPPCLLPISTRATQGWAHALQGPKKKAHVLGTEVGFYHHRSKGVDWVFVDHPSYPRPGGIYADAFGVYGDNQVGLLAPQSTTVR